MTNSECSVNNCNRKYLARGFCSTHYKQWRRTQNVTDIRKKNNGVPDLCHNPKGCIRETYAKDLCKSCYEVDRKKKKKDGTSSNKA